MYKSNLLNSVSFIDHAFFDNTGGVSSGYYSSLNVSINTLDSPKNVQKNHDIIKNKLNTNKLFFASQKHTSKPIYVTPNSKEEEIRTYEADSLITNTFNYTLMTITADCVPILMVDTNNKIISSTHAGWRGIVSGVIQNTINQIKALAKNKVNILAAIGPCISYKNYEVSKSFVESLIIKIPKSKEYIHYINNKYYLSLSSFAKHILLSKNIKEENIEILDIDTYSNLNLFSHRRMLHDKQEYKGLQGSCIKLKK